MKFFFQSSDLVSLNPKRMIHLGSPIDEENCQVGKIKSGINRLEKRVLKSKIKFFLGVIYFLSLAFSLFILLS